MTFTQKSWSSLLALTAAFVVLGGTILLVRASRPQAAGAAPAMAPAASKPGETRRAEISIDPRRQQLMGVRTAAVTRGPLSRTVRALGLVRADQARTADVNVKVEGWLDRLFPSSGTFVHKGDPLFLLESPMLQTTQLEYIQAVKKRDQAKLSDLPDYAERVREKLAFFDVPADQLQAMEAAGRPLRAVLFRAPISGWVVDLTAVQGGRAMPGETLCRILDLSSVWVEADLREADRGLLEPGGRASITVGALPGEAFDGRVVSIAPVVDERSRTTKMRIEVANANGRLNPGMTASVRIDAPLGPGLSVPRDAVLNSGTQQIVFIARGEGVFEPRWVTTGQTTDDAIQIVRGVEEGEQVAVAANFLLDSESQLQSALSGFGGSAAPAMCATDARGLSISLRTTPDPPRTGDVALEVTAWTAGGRSLTSGELRVVFSMPAMPSMNMPAMQSETRVTAGADGVFRGTGQLSMAGRWDVTVSPMGQGGAAGTAHASVLAR